MPSTEAPRQRNQRLEARITGEQKDLIEHAARVQGRTVTDFVVTALHDAARKAITDASCWQLSQEQQKVFVDALMKPAAPNRELREAQRRYRQYKARLGRQ